MDSSAWTRAGVIGIAGFFVFEFVGPVIITGASPAAYVIGISTVLRKIFTALPILADGLPSSQPRIDSNATREAATR